MTRTLYMLMMSAWHLSKLVEKLEMVIFVMFTNCDSQLSVGFRGFWTHWICETILEKWLENRDHNMTLIWHVKLMLTMLIFIGRSVVCHLLLWQTVLTFVPLYMWASSEWFQSISYSNDCFRSMTCHQGNKITRSTKQGVKGKKCY